MKGFTKDKKFHPIKLYKKKGTRMSRDQSVKEKGVKIRKARICEENCLGYTKDMIESRGGIEHEHCKGCDAILNRNDSENYCSSCEDSMKKERKARDKGVFVNNGNLSYHAKVLPNGNIMRTYSSGLVRIVDPDTGAIVRATLGDEDPFKCRVCKKDLKDSDVVTVCEKCDLEGMK